MLNVFYSVDVEVWCDGWEDLDRKFPDAFRRYIYGATPRGEFGLRYQLKRLREHGLIGVFFVEPLFAARFGLTPLAEIVGLVKEHGHEVQMHLHSEWADEVSPPLVASIVRKRQFLRDCTAEEQASLIRAGRDLLEGAGAATPCAFRAGSFGFNAATLAILASDGFRFDSSYNATMYGPESGVANGAVLVEPQRVGAIVEYPLTVFWDGRGLRHVQLGACSRRELEGLLWQAAELGRSAFMMLSHNFELLNPTKKQADEIVVARFDWLCRFLDRHRDSFRTAGFNGLAPRTVERQPEPLSSPLWKTVLRMGEQAMRRGR